RERAHNDDYPNQLMLSPAEVGQAISMDRDSQTGNTLTATLTNRRLLSRLSAFARYDGTLRRLGDEAFTAGLPAQRHFLRALFTADAAVVNGSVELRSDSPGFLQDVQLLLTGFGIQSSIFSESKLGLGGALPDRPATSPGPRRMRGDADNRRHGLRIDSGSLRSFGKHIALLPGRKLEQLSTAISYAISS